MMMIQCYIGSFEFFFSYCSSSSSLSCGCLMFSTVCVCMTTVMMDRWIIMIVSNLFYFHSSYNVFMIVHHHYLYTHTYVVVIIVIVFFCCCFCGFTMTKMMMMMMIKPLIPYCSSKRTKQNKKKQLVYSQLILFHKHTKKIFEIFINPSSNNNYSE